MGDEMSVRAGDGIERVSWWAVERLRGALAPDEYLAARGDLEEIHAGGIHALVEMLGLVARRHLGAWAGWRPWCAVIMIAVPGGVLLGRVSRFWAEGIAAHLWRFVTAAAPASLDGTIWAGDYDPLALIAWSGLSVLTLAAWSWTIGWALRLIARRALLTVAPIFIGVFASQAFGIEAVGGFGASPPSSTMFYGSLLPALIPLCTVALPALNGMTHAGRTAARQPAALVVVVVVSALTFRAVSSLQISLLSGWTSSLVERGSWTSQACLIAMMILPAFLTLRLDRKLSVER